MSPSGLKSSEACSLSGGLRTPAVLMPPSGLKPNSHLPDAPASVFSAEGDTSLPVCVSHRTPGATTTNSLLYRCASIGLQARRATLPCPCAQATGPRLHHHPSSFPDAPASVFKPGGRHFPAGVREPPDPGATTPLPSPMRQHRSSAQRATLPCR